MKLKKVTLYTFNFFKKLCFLIYHLYDLNSRAIESLSSFCGNYNLRWLNENTSVIKYKSAYNYFLSAKSIKILIKL
jgi:hypothetical protein